MTYPSNSDDLPIRKLYDRWERFEDSRREMSEDLKELFAEGKAGGHNPKAMRIAFAERYRQTHDDADKRAKRELQDEEVELYLAALAGVPARAREIIEEFPPVPSFVATSSGGSEYAYDAETGEVLDTSSTAPRKDGSGSGTASAPRVNDGDGEPENSLYPKLEAGTQAPPVETVQADHISDVPKMVEANEVRVAQAEAGSRPTVPVSNPAPATITLPGVPTDEAEPTQVEASSVTPKRKWTHSDPAHRDCLNPEQCGGFSNHGLCQRCKDAAA